MFGGLHEECGVMGIFAGRKAPVAEYAYLGLYALQHRGQESCGIAVSEDGLFRQHRGDGLVAEVFSEEQLAHLGQGSIAVGHVRYSTTGGKESQQHPAGGGLPCKGQYGPLSQRKSGQRQ